MKRFWLAAIGLASAFALAGCSGSTPAATTTPPPPCSDASMKGETVTFKNNVGDSLNGYLLGTGRTGIVLANQLAMDACSWKPYATQLAGRGYRVLAFDFSGDRSAGGLPGSSDHGDVAAAAGFLRERGADRIVLIGASRGGTAVLIAATKVQPPVTGVISLSGPISVNGMNAGVAVPQLTMPVLYIVSDLDAPFHGDAEFLYNATPPKLGKLVVLEGNGHGEQYALGAASTSYRAMQEVDAFLVAHGPVA